MYASVCWRMLLRASLIYGTVVHWR